MRPIMFTLIVDDFGVKYVGKEHAVHLINCLKEEMYKLTEDWTGNLYCGILLRWDYEKQILDISMPEYIKKQLLKYEHPIKLNGAFHTLCAILQLVIASAAEAELGVLFLNCQEGIIF